jgi:hypothetical protein
MRRADVGAKGVGAAGGLPLQEFVLTANGKVPGQQDRALLRPLRPKRC